MFQSLSVKQNSWAVYLCQQVTFYHRVLFLSSDIPVFTSFNIHTRQKGNTTQWLEHKKRHAVCSFIHAGQLMMVLMHHKRQQCDVKYWLQKLKVNGKWFCYCIISNSYSFICPPGLRLGLWHCHLGQWFWVCADNPGGPTWKHTGGLCGVLPPAWPGESRAHAYTYTNIHTAQTFMAHHRIWWAFKGFSHPNLHIAVAAPGRYSNRRLGGNNNMSASQPAIIKLWSTTASTRGYSWVTGANYSIGSSLTQSQIHTHSTPLSVH